MREGYASDAHQLGRYATRRRGAILIATTIDLEARLTDAVLGMADKLIGGLFAKARNATRQRYAAKAGDVARLMRLFHGTIDALAAAQADDRDAVEVVDEAVGWAKLLRVRGEVTGRRGSAAPGRRSSEDSAQVRARPDRPRFPCGVLIRIIRPRGLALSVISALEGNKKPPGSSLAVVGGSGC